jgi:hypothetical protein
MNVIGLLVKGPGGEEYLVTAGPTSATGAGAHLMFRRDASGWVPASLTKEEKALVQADTSVALYKMARQAGVAESTLFGPYET